MTICLHKTCQQYTLTMSVHHRICKKLTPALAHKPAPEAPGPHPELALEPPREPAPELAPDLLWSLLCNFLRSAPKFYSG